MEESLENFEQNSQVISEAEEVNKRKADVKKKNLLTNNSNQEDRRLKIKKAFTNQKKKKELLKTTTNSKQLFYKELSLIPKPEENEIIIPWDEEKDTFSSSDPKTLEKMDLSVSDLTALVKELKSTKYFSADPFSLKRILLCTLLLITFILLCGVLVVFLKNRSSNQGIKIINLIVILITTLAIALSVTYCFGIYYRETEREFFGRREVKFRNIALRVQEKNLANKGICIRIGRFGSYLKIVKKSKEEALEDVKMTKNYGSLIGMKL